MTVWREILDGLFNVVVSDALMNGPLPSCPPPEMAKLFNEAPWSKELRPPMVVGTLIEIPEMGTSPMEVRATTSVEPFSWSSAFGEVVTVLKN